MKINLLLVCTVTATIRIAACAWAQTNASPSPLPPPPLDTRHPTPDTTAPRIEFAATNLDFGKVESGQSAKLAFVFTNTGSQLLEILDVHPGCGCTTAGTYDKKVEPGKTGLIPIEFDSTGYGGPVRKTAVITCNDPARPRLTLALEGTVWRPIDLTPTYASFTLPPDVQTKQTQIVRIVNNLEDPLTLSEPICTNRLFQTELRTAKAGTAFELRVTILPPLDAANVSASVSIKTSSPKVPVLTIPILAARQPAVSIVPNSIFLPGRPLAAEAQMTVTIQNNSTNSLVLSEPGVNAEGVKVQLRETQPGRQYSLTAVFPQGFSSLPAQGIEVRVKSNLPQLPVLKVPVFQLGRASAAAAPPAPAIVTPAPK